MLMMSDTYIHIYIPSYKTYTVKGYIAHADSLHMDAHVYTDIYVHTKTCIYIHEQYTYIHSKKKHMRTYLPDIDAKPT